MYFECKIRYEKVLENGSQKKTTEAYIVNALSFTEAEKKIIEYITPYISGEFMVSAMKIEPYSDIISNHEETADKWYKVKLNFITLDEKSGKEKRIAFYHLYQSSSIEEARKMVVEFMKGSMADYVIEMIKETMIMDVIRD